MVDFSLKFVYNSMLENLAFSCLDLNYSELKAAELMLLQILSSRDICKLLNFNRLGGWENFQL